MHIINKTNIFREPIVKLKSLCMIRQRMIWEKMNFKIVNDKNKTLRSKLVDYT